MTATSFFNFLKPSRLIHGLRQRGAAGAAIHALRKFGASIGVALAGPAVIRINPMGALCNHSCPMCWRLALPPDELEQMQKSDRESGMRLEGYLSLFDSLPAGLGEVSVNGGGEPLLHPEALAVMREIKRRGWRGVLITNGSLLDAAAARDLIEIGWDVTRVSAGAGDRETYRQINGADHFETLRRNLNTFTQLRREAGREKICELILFGVIQRENIPTLEKIFEFGIEAGADSLYFNKIIATEPRLALQPAEMEEARRRLTDCSRRFSIPFNLDEILAQLTVAEECIQTNRPFRPAAWCSVGFDEAFIDSVGRVTPCCYSSEVLGDLREQSFKDIWRGKKYRDFRRRLRSGQYAAYCLKAKCAIKAVLHD